MSGFLSQLQFAQPLFLLLLILLPLLWLRWRRLSLPAILWRSVVLLLLVLALADPRDVKQATKPGARIFAFDLSRSIPDGMRLWMAQQSLVPQTGDHVFVFGGAAEEVKDWQRWLKGKIPSERIKPEQTNLEALFSTLLRLPSAPRSVFLFTDGWETEGDVERLLPSLGQAGIRVFPVLPPEQPATANVAVKKVVAPYEGTRGEAINLRVLLENYGTREVEGSLLLKRNGQPLKTEAVRLKPGGQIFAYQTALNEGGLLSFQAQFTPRDPNADLFPQDNQATAWVAVQSKEKVLLLNGRAGEGSYIEELLKRRGFEVTSLTAGASPPSPTDYGVVIFNNVEREKFSPAYLGAIERHVNAGNSFLMLGDDGSFAAGGYRQTPIEAVLPVELSEPKEEERSRAVIVIIDKSGSMRDENKLVYAKEAAKAVIGQLSEDDLIGVIGFDTEAFVVVPLSQVKKIRPTFGAQIDRLVAGGQTYLLPALEQAMPQLRSQPAGHKHVIVLSDGIELGGSRSDYIDLVTVMKNNLKITVSTVAIGEKADVPLMKRIAQYGGGLFHHTNDASTLPQIAVQQTPQRPPESPQQEKDFIPVAATGSEILAGLPDRSFPPMKGYVETELKRGARLDLMIPHDGKNSPLLASWRYGKGKAVAFTTDQAGRWSKEWIPWGGLERFWGKVFDWLRPGRETLPPHEIRINLSGNQAVLDLYLYGEESDGNPFGYSYSYKSMKGEGILKRLAPGHYRAELPFASAGNYRIELREERRGQTISYPAVGYTLAAEPKAEIPWGDFNLPLLERIALATGGTINPSLPSLEREYKTDAVPIVTPLRSYFIFLCALLFLLELFFRRFFLSEA